MQLTSELRTICINQTKNCYSSIQVFLEKQNFAYDSVNELYKQYIELCLSLQRIDEYKKIRIETTKRIPSRFLSFFSYSPYTEQDDIFSKLLSFRFHGSYLSSIYNNKIVELFEEALSNLDTIHRLI